MKIRFALAGCGKISWRHVECMQRYGQLVAACDNNEARLQKMVEETGAEGFSDVAHMCSQCKVDVLVICTPNGLHMTHTLDGLNNGFHVICEKPMALSPADCKKMIDTAVKCGRHLFVVKQNRYNPPVVMLADLLKRNILGKIGSFQLNCFWSRKADYYTDSWRGTTHMDGGILFTQFSHFIDVVSWLFGELKSVQGVSSNFFHKGVTDFADTIIANAIFNNGTIGSLNFTTNAHSRNMEGSLTVFGEKGTIKIGGQYLNMVEYHDVPGIKLTGTFGESKSNNYGHYEGSMSNHHLVYRNVAHVLLNNGNMDTTPEDGLRTIEIIEKIHSAILQRTPDIT